MGLNLRRGGAYKEQIICRFFVEGIRRNFRGTMCRWRADNQEAMLEDLIQQVQSLLDFQGGNRGPTRRKKANGLKMSEEIRSGQKAEEKSAWLPRFKITLLCLQQVTLPFREHTGGYRW